MSNGRVCLYFAGFLVQGWRESIHTAQNPDKNLLNLSSVRSLTNSNTSIKWVAVYQKTWTFFYMSTLQCTSVNNHTLPCHQSSQRYTAVRKLITSVLTPSQQSACQHTHRCSCLQVVLWSAVLKIIRMCDRGCRYLYVNADKAEAFIHFLSFFLPAFKKQQLRVISPWLCVCVYGCVCLYFMYSSFPIVNKILQWYSTL